MAPCLFGRAGIVLQMFYSRLAPKVISDARVLYAICVPYQQSRHVVTVVRDSPKKLTKSLPEKASLLHLRTIDAPRETFIPVTRRSLVRQLMEEENFLTDDEQQKFESLTLSLDSAILNKYHSVLQELKLLFDPINPDKDTVVTRSVNRRERLDNEFWLIQKLAGILEKANFRELPRSEVERALSEHQALDGVMVSVDLLKYDVVRYWVLGHETPMEPPRFVEQMLSRLTNSRPLPRQGRDYYKRVIVAVRLKRDDKLMLKAFKDVPVSALEQLLPDGRVKMRKLDWGLMISATAVASAGIIAKVVTHLADVHSDWMLIVTGVASFVALKGWSVYRRQHNAYLLQLNRMLYFKNIANNRSLLSLLVDRAEDELFKECLLTYTFLLTHRPPSAQSKHSSAQRHEELGSLTKAQLEQRIQEWIFRKTMSKIEFKCDEAVSLLKQFGILTQDSDSSYQVLPLDAAVKHLPVTVQTLALHKEEYDLEEGYDKDIRDERDEAYKEEEQKRRSFGWF